VVATIGDASNFTSARHLSAALGLTPKQNNSGGKPRQGGISKAENTDLRRLLFIGAIAVIRSKRAQEAGIWLARLLERRPAKVVAIALANKSARIIWAMLRRGVAYRFSLMARRRAVIVRRQGQATVCRGSISVIIGSAAVPIGGGRGGGAAGIPGALRRNPASTIFRAPVKQRAMPFLFHLLPTWWIGRHPIPAPGRPFEDGQPIGKARHAMAADVAPTQDRRAVDQGPIRAPTNHAVAAAAA